MMQRRLILVTILLLLATAAQAQMFGPVLPAPSPAIGVVINGQAQQYDTPPTIINGRVMVPLRGIFESLGAEVRWLGPLQRVTATQGDRQVSLTVGVEFATVDGRSVTLEAAPRILQDRVFVPLTFVAQELGADVTWEAAARQVVVNTPPPAPAATAAPEQPAQQEVQPTAPAQPVQTSQPPVIILPQPPPIQAPAPAVADERTVNVSLYEWGISLAPEAIRAGQVTFNITNNGNLNHGFAIVGVNAATPELAPGDSASVTVSLRSGVYTIFCPIDGHRLSGMTALLRVSR